MPWAPPLFAFGPEPPPDRKALAAQRRLARLNQRAGTPSDHTGEVEAEHADSPTVLLEIGRQLDENSFCILDGLLGAPAATALHDFAHAKLSHLTSDEGVGRVAGANGKSQGAAVSAFRSDLSIWATATGQPAAGQPPDTSSTPLRQLAVRMERLIGALRNGTYLASADIGADYAASEARAAAARTHAQLRDVRWRAAEAMLSVYPTGGAHYIRHVDNVCTRGVGKRCNGRRLNEPRHK